MRHHYQRVHRHGWDPATFEYMHHSVHRTLDLRGGIRNLAYLIAFDLRPHPIAPTDDPAGQVLCLDHDGTGRPDDHVVYVTAPSERQIVNDDVLMPKLRERVAHDVFS